MSQNPRPFAIHYTESKNGLITEANCKVIAHAKNLSTAICAVVRRLLNRHDVVRAYIYDQDSFFVAEVKLVGTKIVAEYADWCWVAHFKEMEHMRLLRSETRKSKLQAPGTSSVH